MLKLCFCKGCSVLPSYFQSSKKEELQQDEPLFAKFKTTLDSASNVSSAGDSNDSSGNQIKQISLFIRLYSVLSSVNEMHFNLFKHGSF